MDAYKDKIWRPLLEVVKPGFDLSGHTIFFDRQDLPVPVYPPAWSQSLFHETGLPLLVFTISQTDNFVAQLSLDETGDVVVDYAWTKEDGWKKSSVTYPDMGPGFRLIVSKVEVEDIPESYWSLKHCYIK